MVQPIQVPQTNPNAPQFQVPTDLVNAYLNRRQQDQQFAVNQVDELGKTYNALQQQKIQNKLAAKQARVTATRLIGPEMANQIYADQDPTAPGQIPPQGTPQNATLPPNQDQAPSPYIQASIAAGHPAQPGIAAFHAPSQPQGTPDYPGQLQGVQNQMEQFNNQGEYGREQSGQLAQQVPLITAQMNNAREADQFSKNQTREKEQFAISQANEKNRTVTGEVAKLSPQVQEANMLEGMYGDLNKSLTSAGKAKTLPGSGNLFNATKGYLGNADAGLAINQAKVIVPTINKILTSRFNMGENQVLGANMSPSPSANPNSPYNKQRMGLIKQVIDAIKTGNALNVKNVVAAVNGQAVDFGSPMESASQNSNSDWKYIGPVKK